MLIYLATPPSRARTTSPTYYNKNLKTIKNDFLSYLNLTLKTADIAKRRANDEDIGPLPKR